MQQQSRRPTQPRNARRLRAESTPEVAQVSPEMETDGSPVRRLIPVTKWAETHSWPPVGGLRHLIYNASSKNGFDRVVRRCGTRVLIDEQAFFSWVEAQQGVKK